MRRLNDLLTLLPVLLVATACLEADSDDDDEDDSDTGDFDLYPGGVGGGVGGGTGDGGVGGGGDGGGASDDPYDRSYAGGYNVGTCGADLPEATSPTGPSNGSFTTWEVGDVLPNMTFVDQHGESVDLYSFCGQHVMIAFGAPWCGPCRQLAGEAQHLQDQYGEQGFQMIEVLLENAGGAPASQADMQAWADDYGMTTVPVFEDSAYQLWPYMERDWGIPTIVHIGPGMEVLSVDDRQGSPAPWL